MGNSKIPHHTGYFATDHLYLAAFLTCYGHDVVSTTPATGTRVYFLFDDSPALRSTAADFMAGGKVEARKFSFVLLRLKKKFPKFRY
jgi:hypothetical protein